jgi:predicted nucleic acid-binding Zn ribbon protein
VHCPHCGVTNPPFVARCDLCGELLSLPVRVTDRQQIAIRVALAIVIPFVVYQLFAWLLL